jgi:hypothetical protein
MAINETAILNLVEEVTGGENTAYFQNGTMFLNTGNSHVAITVFNAIFETITPCVSVVKVSAVESAYDFF